MIPLATIQRHKATRIANVRNQTAKQQSQTDRPALITPPKTISVVNPAGVPVHR